MPQLAGCDIGAVLPTVASDAILFVIDHIYLISRGVVSNLL